MVKDTETGTYADHTKVHPIHFEGKFFKVRGSVEHGTLAARKTRPSYRPGDHHADARFAAKHADSSSLLATVWRA